MDPLLFTPPQLPQPGAHVAICKRCGAALLIDSAIAVGDDPRELHSRWHEQIEQMVDEIRVLVERPPMIVTDQSVS